MKRPIFSIILGSALVACPAYADTSPAPTASADSRAAVTESSKVIAGVSAQVKAAPSKAGEIVKAVIRSSEANPQLVSEIVVAAVNAAPEQIESISKAAMAVAPDAFSAVVVALAKLDGYNMDEVAAGQNPLLSPGDEGVLTTFLAGIASKVQSGELRSVLVSSAGGGSQGGSILISFINAVTNPAVDGGQFNFPIAFYLPSGLVSGSQRGLVSFQYDDYGNTTGIIINTSPTAPIAP